MPTQFTKAISHSYLYLYLCVSIAVYQCLLSYSLLVKYSFIPIAAYLASYTYSVINLATHPVYMYRCTYVTIVSLARGLSPCLSGNCMYNHSLVWSFSVVT